jgi:MFS family permease
VSITATLPDKVKPETIHSDIPARLDRLPWSRFHWLLIMALGVTWVLDGLEVTVVGSIGPTLTAPQAPPGAQTAAKAKTLRFTTAELGLANSVYLAGALGGALVFGHLTDRLGRKRLFTITLLIYLAGAALTVLSWNFWSFALFRAITGMAIGGEYSAINSAIDELIPARVRGRVDLIVNGTFWVGAAAGSLVCIELLNPNHVPVWLGWRLAFGLGAIVGLGMIFARQYVPESPRWLLTHGQKQEAERIMDEIEMLAVGPKGAQTLPGVHQQFSFRPTSIGFGRILHTLLVRYRGRAFLGLVLISSQAFLFNGIVFTYPLVLKDFFNVPAPEAPGYTLLFDAGCFMGPLLLGHLFDTHGRRRMITFTYALSGLMIIGSEFLFLHDLLTANTQTLLWAATFFFASAAASAGYLTVSEVFPLEMRALVIALFYILGTAIGGLAAPALFGNLIQTGRPADLAIGYFLGAGLMLLAAATEFFMGVDSERKSLEEVASPLSAAE